MLVHSVPWSHRPPWGCRPPWTMASFAGAVKRKLRGIARRPCTAGPSYLRARAIRNLRGHQQGNRVMKSQLFKDIGIPLAECEIEPALDPRGVPRLWFRSVGNPLVGLDLTGASQLRQMFAHAGDADNANEIDRHIAKARL